jgi:putative ABC transport system permease protein
VALPLKYSARNVWLRRQTTFATAIGIALVVFVFASSLMLAGSVELASLNAGSDDRALVMQHDAYSESQSSVGQSVLGVVAAAPGVRRGTDGIPQIAGELVLQLPFSKAGERDENFSVQLRGVTETSFHIRPIVAIVEGRAARRGTREAIVGRGLLGQYEGLQIGGRFEIGKNMPLEVVGVFEAAGAAYESEVWVDLDTLRTALGWQGYLSSVTVQLSSGQAFEGFALALQQDKRQGLRVERERVYYKIVSQNLFDGIVGLGAVLTFIVSLGAILGCAISAYANVGQRVPEIGVLRALGFSSRHVVLAFMLESLAVALVGAAAGLALALVTTCVEFSTTNMTTGQAVTFSFRPEPGVLVTSVLIGAAVGLLGGFCPALKAARVSPSRSLRA